MIEANSKPPSIRSLNDRCGAVGGCTLNLSEVTHFIPASDRFNAAFTPLQRWFAPQTLCITALQDRPPAELSHWQQLVFDRPRRPAVLVGDTQHDRVRRILQQYRPPTSFVRAQLSPAVSTWHFRAEVRCRDGGRGH